MYNQSIERRRHFCSLRTSGRKAFTLALALLSIHTVQAQSFPNGLSADSVSPRIDSVVIAQMNHRMDSIRKADNRPTIALVLSGGGAKGSAHIGVKKLIDELEIPVDMICGTSMGGLMGGMMALGYDCNFLDSLLRNQDWSITLTDKVEQKYIPYTLKKYKATFAVNIPFHLEDEAFAERIQEQEKHLRGARQGTNSFLTSLPSGYVNGFNVNNFLSSFSVGYQDSIDFKELPIPFFCVAADIVSCKAKNWSSGSVINAMRSTMSIPGLFNPVRTDGMVLVDGGTRNNFPVDLARAMGADIVIGVDLSDVRPNYSEVNNALDMLMQFITMLGTDSFQKNKGNCDIFIKPNLKGFNMLSFSPAAIDTIISRGYAAANVRREELLALKKFIGPDSKPYLNNRVATDIGQSFVSISSVIFNGVTDRESKFLQKKVNLKAGQQVNAKIINEAMSRLQATGAFSSVTYSLLGASQPYKLQFNCVKGPTHHIGFGFRGDTEEWPSLIADLGLNTGKIMGSKFDLMGKLGKNRYAIAHYILDVPYIPTINVRASVAGISPDLVGESSGIKGNINMLYHDGSIFLSNLGWTNFDLQVGLQSRMSYLRDNTPIGSIIKVLYETQACYIGAFAKLSTYTLDSYYYPSKGHTFSLAFEHDFAKLRDSGYKPANLVKADFNIVIPICKFFAIIPDLHYRGSFLNPQSTEKDAFSFIHTNCYGGVVASRYVEGQVPFVGFNNLLHSSKQNLGLINLDLRFNPFKNVYASLQGGIAQEFDFITDIKDKSLAPRYLGAGVEFGYNSLVGPIKMNVHWSDLNHSWAFYFGFGFDF